jgi:hypothetical protein
MRHSARVVRAGALEVDARIAVNECFLADDHGIDQGRLARRPKFVNFGNDARVHSIAYTFDAAAGESGE